MVPRDPGGVGAGARDGEAQAVENVDPAAFQDRLRKVVEGEVRGELRDPPGRVQVQPIASAKLSTASSTSRAPFQRAATAV